MLTLVVLPALVMGPEHALFFQRVSTSSVLGAADGVLRDFNSQYAPAVSAGSTRAAGTGPGSRIAWAKLGSGAALAVVAALVLVAARSTSPRIAARREFLGFVLITCSLPFWLRTSWSHYFVHLPRRPDAARVRFCRTGRGRETRLAIALLVAPSVYLSNVLGLFATEGWWYYANAGSLFFANALVLVGCAAFVVDAHLSDRGPRNRAA